MELCRHTPVRNSPTRNHQRRHRRCHPIHHQHRLAQPIQNLRVLIKLSLLKDSRSIASRDKAVHKLARDCVLMKSSTKDKIKGTFKEAKGSVKEKAGKATRNPDLRDRGTLEKAGGKVQRKIGDIEKVFEQ